MIKRLEKKELVEFFNKIRSDYPIYLPKETMEGHFSFKKAVDIDFNHIDLEGPATMTPPTTFLIPYQEDILKYNQQSFKEVDGKETLALVDVKKYDLEAINQLKKIFKDDKFFAKNADNLILITSDVDHQSLFSRAMMNKEIEGFDLKISMIGSDYQLESGSVLGDKLLGDYLSIIVKQKEVIFRDKKSKTKEPILSLDKIKWAIEKTRPDKNDRNKGKVWQKWSKVCLGCGNCSYVCPMCFCYRLEDRVDFNGQVTRQRRQSSCFLYSFDKMASGNPKERFVDRFYHWYYHKFVAMPEQYGFSGCVNCGRCIKYCPVEINFRNVINEAIEEAENE